MAEYEYRVLWGMSTVAIVGIQREREATWLPIDWLDDDMTLEEIEAYFNSNEIIDRSYNVPPGMDMAIEQSGFEWWVEVREAV